MIAALRGSVVALLDDAPTTQEEDEALLALSSLKPAMRSAITLRLREKQLLQRALKNTEALEKELDRLEVKAEEEDRAAQDRLLRERRRHRLGQLEGEGDDSEGEPEAVEPAGADVLDNDGDEDEEDKEDREAEEDEDYEEDWDFLEGVGASDSEQALLKAKIKEEASTIHYFQLWAREREEVRVCVSGYECAACVLGVVVVHLSVQLRSFMEMEPTNPTKIQTIKLDRRPASDGGLSGRVTWP